MQSLFMNIRTATLADSEVIYRFLARVFEDERDCFDETSQTQIASELRDGFTWLVAESDGTREIIGCVCLHENHPTNPHPRRTGWIGHTAVDPSRRRQQLGTSLMREAERRLKERGCIGAVIGVLTFKAPTLLPFYELQGYVATKHRGQAVGRKEGCNRNTDLILMLKSF